MSEETLASLIEKYYTAEKFVNARQVSAIFQLVSSFPSCLTLYSQHL